MRETDQLKERFLIKKRIQRLKRFYRKYDFDKKKILINT